MPPVQKICRQNSSDYLSFGGYFLSSEAMKPSRLKHHFDAKHSDKDKPLSYFLQLSSSFKKQIQTFNTLLQEIENNWLIASYNIALLVAKSGKSHTTGETLFHPVIEEVLSTVIHEKPDNIMERFPLSNNTISRRIDEMANDVKHQLINILQRSEFSIQVDESTIVDNQCLIMVYVRYFNKDLQPCEEMLFREKLPLDSKGATTFHTLKFFLFEHNISLSNILACASDRAPSMVGRYRDFSSLLKREISHKILTVHYLAHRQHLVAKTMNSRLNDALQLVIKTVNNLKPRTILNSYTISKCGGCQKKTVFYALKILHYPLH
ncbi:Hypothetical predicted protein [Octopus vulgaris]|uniref:Zinc finger BED domain-containing protein 5-like n=1 Tax=Octopus vulgaris TaxID=6645 RepID=A0AA36FEP9_OCTVU|nr:Hypothetical predicted protein [Octopus vulgaris]